MSCVQQTIISIHYGLHSALDKEKNKFLPSEKMKIIINPPENCKHSIRMGPELSFGFNKERMGGGSYLFEKI